MIINTQSGYSNSETFKKTKIKVNEKRTSTENNDKLMCDF